MKNKKIVALISIIAVCAIALAAIFCFNINTSAPVKVILDCDMGYMNDDALCLSMLLKAEEAGLVDILGVTLEGGNNFIDAPYMNYGEIQYGSAKYTEELLTALNRTDIQYYRGTDYPTGIGRNDLQMLNDYYENLEYSKFNDGYGAIHFFTEIDSNLLCDSDEACEFLIKTVEEYPGEVVIFAVGPTMNIARAVNEDPEFAASVKSIYYMGGALGDPCIMENVQSESVEGIEGANVTPVTEYNVLYDPVAFETCITANFTQQYICPGSCNVDVNLSVAEKLEECSNDGCISKLWVNHYKEYIQDYPYWDPMTVYAFLCPEAVTEAECKYVTVDTDRLSTSFGCTVGISPDEYAKLSSEEQQQYGKADVIYCMSGFWDYAIALLCK